MRIVVSVLFVIFMIACENKEQLKKEGPSNKVSLMMEKYADSILIQPEIRAVSIGLVYQGEKYSGHYGSLKKGGMDKPSDQTVYEIGSVTKTMIGTLLAKAVLEHKLSIEDDIRNYLPEEYPNLEYNGTAIRIKHLITHTSRLPYFLPLSAGNVFGNLNKEIPFLLDTILMDYNKEKFFADLHHVAIDTLPGVRYTYSNAGAEIAGYILTSVYNKSLDQLIHEYYGKAYEMVNTSVNKTDNEAKNIAYGRWMKNEVVSPSLKNPLWGAAGNVRSTTEDMLNYMLLQLDDTNPIIKTAHTLLYTDEERNHLAYFWRINKEENEGTTYSHHGGTPGMQNWVYLFPDYDLGVFVITNQSGPQTAGYLASLIQNLFDDLKLQSDN